MTYRELAERIASMTDDQKDSIVYFIEPYDDPAIHEVSIHFDKEELIIWHDIDENDESTEIPPGFPHLCC